MHYLLGVIFARPSISESGFLSSLFREKAPLFPGKQFFSGKGRASGSGEKNRGDRSSPGERRENAGTGGRRRSILPGGHRVLDNMK